MEGHDVLVAVMLLTLLYAVVYILKTAMDSFRHTRTEKLQADLSNKMIDKFGASQDLLAYLQTGAGQSFLKAAPVERAMPFGRILNSVQAGVVLVALGISLFIVGDIAGAGNKEPLTSLGIIGLALGAGLLASGGASWFLSKRLGLLKEE